MSNSQFAFLANPGDLDQVALGSGVFMNAPDDSELVEFDLEDIQALAEREAKKNTNITPDATKVGKPYCGENKFVWFWTLYYMKYGKDPTHPHYGFRNPFYYDRIPTPWEAFAIGKNLSNAQNSNSNAVGRPAAGPVPAAAVVAAPAPVAARRSVRRGGGGGSGF